MLHIFICEDIESYRMNLTKWIKDIVMIENFDMKLVLATSDPMEMIHYIEENKSAGLYFLDVDLNTDINGIELAERIREYDPRGFIVFVTAYGDKLHLTFKYRVEAMDYIVKDLSTDIRKRIHGCIVDANKKYTQGATELQKNFVIRVDDKTISIPYNEILYIETSSFAHKLILHSTKRQLTFNSRLKDVEQLLDGRFYKSHKSVIVNLNRISEIDDKNNLLILKDTSKCAVAVREKKKIAELLKEGSK